MKTESNKKTLDDNSFEYLLSVLNRDYEFARSYNERGWEIFKYYITMVTAISGLFIALISAGFSVDTLIPLVPFSTGALFIIGITAFIQLLNIDLDHTRLIRRNRITMQYIEHFTSLDEYFQKVSVTYHDKSSYSYGGRYTIFSIIKRSLIASGIKTQLTLINSAIGAFGISLAFLNKGVSTSIDFEILSGIIVFFVLVFLHGIYGNLKGRATKYLDNIGNEDESKAKSKSNKQ